MNYEQTNDPGPLFSRVFDYNVKAISSFTFGWPSNDRNHGSDYHLISRTDDLREEHYDRVKIKKSVMYDEFFRIIDATSPQIVFIFSRFLEPNKPPSKEPKPNSKVTTFVYGGSDLRLDLISKWFPSLRYLYIYQLSKSEPRVKANLENLETLSCWYADLEAVSMLEMPNLENLDIYRIVGPERNLRLSGVSRLRIDWRADFTPDSGFSSTMRTLQYFPATSCGAPPDDEKRKNIASLLKRFNPQDVILPPSMLQDEEITLLHEALSSNYNDDNFALGVYINDSAIEMFIKTFDSLQIFDHKQPLRCMSVRKGPVKNYLPKDMDDGIMERMFRDQGRQILLSNFNIFTTGSSDWLRTFGKLQDSVYICSSELLMDGENRWPNLVKNTKNRVLIYNSETDSVYLDINRKPIFAVAEMLKQVYKVAKFKNVYIVVRMEEGTANHQYEQLLHTELGLEKKLNIYKYDVPAKIMIYK